MVTVIAPFAGSSASGTLGRAIAYSKSKRGTAVSKTRRPKQPRTLAQRATRLWLTWLSQQWKTLPTAAAASWTAAAAKLNTAPYSAFIKANTNRLQHLPGNLGNPAAYEAWPSQADPPGRTGLLGSYADEYFTPGPGYVDFSRNVTSINQQWGYAYFLINAENPSPTSRSLCCIETVQLTGWKVTRITDLPPGPCTIRFVRFSTDALTTAWWNVINTNIP